MTDDLKSRLRAWTIGHCDIMYEAADRIEQLEAERDSFYMEYRIKCDEQTKALHVERDELKAAIKNFLCAWDNCRSSGEWPVRRLEELRAAITKEEKNG